MTCNPRIHGAIAAGLAALAAPVATGQEGTVAPSDETDLSLDAGDLFDEEDASITHDRSFWDKLGENLRLDVDVIARGGYYARHGEPQGLFAVGLDLHKVFSDDQGDIGTLLLQPYLVYRSNPYDRYIRIDGDDTVVLELHQFYFDLTRFGRGRTDVRVGHFYVPYGLQQRIDTHFTLHQLFPVANTGSKLDWGVELHGTFPEFDYAVSMTTGTGMDLTGNSTNTYLVSGRIGTPTEENFIVGLSSLYGQIHDDHVIHRVDEGDPDERAEEAGFVRRWRVGVDATQIVSQFTINAQVDAGQDFDSAVFNALVELNWFTVDQNFTAYIQGIYAGLDGNLGWDEDVQLRLGCLWKLGEDWKLSAQWVHEFETYAEIQGEEHLNEDLIQVQLRVTF